LRLSEILDERRISVALRAVNKDSALSALTDLFVRDDEALDADAILRSLREREALASTGVGSGVAIPHGRLPNLQRIVAAVGVCPDGVEFDAVDGRPARILVAVLAPEQQAAEHLKALARLSRLLRDDSVRERVQRAGDPRQALAVFLEEDARR
jgi:PTS system nitrogen regulatory IIA component